MRVSHRSIVPPSRRVLIAVMLLLVSALAVPLLGCDSDPSVYEGEAQERETPAQEPEEPVQEQPEEPAQEQPEGVEKLDDGPALVFSDIDVWTDIAEPSSYKPDLWVHLCIDGNVTNRTASSVGYSNMPVMTMYCQGEQLSSYPFVGGMDGVEVLSLGPGETTGFQYYFTPPGVDCEWSIRQSGGYDYTGLEGIDEEIARELGRAWEERPQILAQQAEERRAEEEARNNRCYITPNGSSYHRSDYCRTLSRSNEIYETTRDEAEAQGYTPCDFCY